MGMIRRKYEDEIFYINLTMFFLMERAGTDLIMNEDHLNRIVDKSSFVFRFEAQGKQLLADYSH